MGDADPPHFRTSLVLSCMVCDISAGDKQENDTARFVLDRHKCNVSDARRAIPKNVARFFAKWCARGGPFERFASPFQGFGHVPPTGLPEQFAHDVRACKAKVLNGGAVGMNDSALHVTMAGKQASS
jgi:hypothetical protein